MKKLLDICLMILIAIAICSTAYAATSSLVKFNWSQEPASLILLFSSLAGVVTRRKARV